ncbi:hypothetical protein GXW83_24135 [Streptacidiphilus sp. PB12-B1b]|uniref:hypothetical protein n=1 Tax=Streptacidiphilus sp. PB12-B1b TaxID=2705012 RepID=UPI0015F964B6|nr:hypothetical protein [Streptacidiphilus sp. PB12-B1b]QMU78336.1 hypothetical protein GXW83_24135 [Streptacidiphilus sp. PB12-B1b]
MNTYASPIQGVGISWLVAIAMALALAFPFSFYSISAADRAGVRLRLLGASLAGFAVTAGLGLLRGNSVSGIIVLYCDVMVTGIIGGLLISSLARKITPGVPVDQEKAQKLGYKLGGLLMAVICILLFLEYGPI